MSNSPIVIVDAEGGDASPAHLEVVKLPDFYLDFSVSDSYNGEFGFDKYDKKTHFTNFIGGYPLRGDIKDDYRPIWLSIWPPKSEIQKLGIGKECLTKATIKVELKRGGRKDYIADITAIIPKGLKVNGVKNECTFKIENKKKPIDIEISCIEPIETDEFIEFQNKEKKVVGAIRVKANTKENICVANVKLYHTILVDGAIALEPKSVCGIDPNKLEEYFNKRSFNQSLIYVNVDKDVEIEELNIREEIFVGNKQKEIDSLLTNKTVTSITSNLSKDKKDEEGNKEINSFLAGKKGSIRVIIANKPNQIAYIDQLTLEGKITTTLKKKRAELKKNQKEKIEINKKIENRDKAIKKAVKSKKEKDYEKIEQEYGIIIDRTNGTSTPKVENETLEDKVKKLDSEIQKAADEMGKLSNSFVKPNTYNIHISNDIFACYESDSMGMVAGFALTGKNDACLFGCAVKDLRYDLFTHELGHVFGLGEYFNDLESVTNSVYKGDSIENFMDYNVPKRKTFHKWQWNKMITRLKK